MYVYLGGSYAARQQLMKDRIALERAGLVVTARWLAAAHDCAEKAYVDVLGDGDVAQYEHFSGMLASCDVEDIKASDAAVFYLGQESTSCGFHFEAGFGLGRGIPVLCYGEVDAKVPLMFCHPGVERHRTVHGVAARLVGLNKERTLQSV